jgi:N-methylhydantoinase A
MNKILSRSAGEGSQPPRRRELMVRIFRAGVDIGGTFTDIVLLSDNGERYTKKVSSTVDDYARAIVDGLSALLTEIGAEPGHIVELLHGTTVASNAILEHKGAKTGLITTRGFRDVLEIRNLRMPRLYDMSWTKPVPLVERRLRVEVDERVNAQGGIDRPLDEASVERAVRFLVDEGVEAIAVCLLHSYLNPAHELRTKAIAERLAPDVILSVSAEVLPVINEYERTSTSVINAYVRPIVERYLRRLIGEVARTGIRAPVLLMQSNGGLTTAQAAAVTPMHIIESGPAAGVVGVQALTRRIGIDKAISFDMGGTTAKASLIENGEVTRATEYQVGAGIVLGSRLLSGAGYTLKVPAIDLAEVGAGGGSILWIDAGGALQIGPHSAGAVPGPVCYDQGGAEPTVTDANVVLGYLNPAYLVGGALKLNADKSRAAIAEKIARPLSMSVEEAAYGAHLIAASNMIRALKAVSSERGRDPREYALVGFGGNGPVFAAGMAEAMHIPQVLIPPSAGVFSSFGLLYAEVEYYFTRTRKTLLSRADPDDLQAAVSALEAEARARLAADGFGPDHIAIRRSASLHYQGQSFELRVKLAAGAIDRAALVALEEAFGAEHERTYGHRAGVEEPVELVSLEVIGRGVPEKPRAAAAAAAGLAPDVAIAEPRRRAYFGPQRGWQEALVINRNELATPRPGPCIVEEYDATCLVPPGWTARLDEYGNMAMRRQLSAAPRE